MNGILRAKRKVHYLVNYLFYFFIFGSGFLVGFFLNGNKPDLKSIFEVLI